ncbi:phosphopantothenoylcysteine decarboxylase [Mycoplasma sp. P36-A1]|uniref:phosphopantothenoylcysteine decarboxylase domain-containing protein n=1 Tax=Mycoplasma sp. P36-A1 TaxID=3252900 RepID=UPI003C305CD9
MNILITSGATTEKIDQLRQIVNISAGALGSIIAEYFKTKVPTVNIDYVATKDARIPNGVTSHIVNDIKSLKNELENLLDIKQYDIIIHAMTVGDFQLERVYDQQEVTRFIVDYMNNHKDIEINAEMVSKALEKMPFINNRKKISSDHENIVISMKRSDKIIADLRENQPNAIIVGFKLLDHVAKNELIDASIQQVDRYNTNYCIANDLCRSDDGNHDSLIINSNGRVIAQTGTKSQLAQVIYDHVTKDFKKKQDQLNNLV